MSARSTHWAAVLLVGALVAALGLGCGGTTEPTTTSTDVSVIPTLPVGGGGSDDNGHELLLTQLDTTEDTPAEYVDAVAQGRPVVLVFYVGGGSEDVRVLESIDRLQPAFEDYVFLLYDYKMPSAYGDLSTLLKVSYPPEVVLIDGTGTIREIWNGYVDEGTLNQGLVNIGRG